MVLEVLEAVLAADAQAVVVLAASEAVVADSKKDYEVQRCASYSFFMHTFNEMPSMSDNTNIDEDIIVSVINDDFLPLKEAIESLIENY